MPSMISAARGRSPSQIAFDASTHALGIGVASRMVSRSSDSQPRSRNSQATSVSIGYGEQSAGTRTVPIPSSLEASSSASRRIPEASAICARMQKTCSAPARRTQRQGRCAPAVAVGVDESPRAMRIRRASGILVVAGGIRTRGSHSVHRHERHVAHISDSEASRGSGRRTVGSALADPTPCTEKTSGRWDGHSEGEELGRIGLNRFSSNRPAGASPIWGECRWPMSHVPCRSLCRSG